MLNRAPDPLPLVEDCAMFVKLVAPFDEPPTVTEFMPDPAVPLTDAEIAPLIGELPDADALMILPMKSYSKLPATKTK